MIEQTYFLDMIPGESTPPVVHVSQFDVNSRTLTFNLMKGGVAFVPDAGMSVTLDGMKPDNHVFSYPMTVNGSSVSIDVLTQMTVVSGHVRCEVSVSNQNGKIGSANFILAVEESPIDSGSISESDIPIFEDLKNQAQQAAADAEQSASDAETAATSVSAMMATVESTSIASKAYSVGDYLVLNGKLYEVTRAIIRGGRLTVGTNISETTVGGELTSLNSNLNQKVSSVNGETPDSNGNVEIDATGIETSSGVAIKSVNGNHVTIADALQGKALGVTVTLEPIQSGSGDPSPTNIRPITGRTQVEISNKDSEDVEQASVTVNLGQTVYGGTLNVTTGLLTVDRAMVDLGTKNFNYVSTFGGAFQTEIPDHNAATGEGACSAFRVVFSGGDLKANDGSVYMKNNGTFVYIHDSRYTDPTAFKSAMSGVQLVYELATPQTIQLTPAQIQLLTGTNIISTNADDLSVRYYATGQTGNVEGNIAFLSEKTVSNENAISTVSESIAPAETGTATQNYAIDSYLMLNNRLCKVTSAIATGEQIIVGSNVQYTTVAEELTAILAQINA